MTPKLAQDILNRLDYALGVGDHKSNSAVTYLHSLLDGERNYIVVGSIYQPTIVLDDVVYLRADLERIVVNNDIKLKLDEELR